MRKIIIILDGLADQINTKTSLESAHTPNLDKLVKNSLAGLMYPIKNIAPESGSAQFTILGNNLKKYPGRGIIEALGANIKVKPNHTYLRVNFAQKNNIRVKIPKNINKLNKIDKDIKIYPTKGYRAILEVKGIHKNINNTHPGYITYKNYSKAVTPSKREITCKNKKVNNFIKQVKNILKDKTILIRGASYKLPKTKPLKNWSMMAEMPIEIGLGKLLKMKIIKKDLKKLKLIKSNIYIQLKGPDPYGHRGDKKGKIRAIEKIDKQLKFLKNLKDIIVITADHATPYNLKRHSKDPVPFLIYNKTSNNINKFTEKACKRGKIIQGKDLMKLLY